MTDTLGMASTTTTDRKGTAMTDHGFSTTAYRARSTRDAARILDRHKVTGTDRVRAVRAFYRDGFAIVPVPAGRVVINRKRAREVVAQYDHRFEDVDY